MHSLSVVGPAISHNAVISKHKSRLRLRLRLRGEVEVEAEVKVKVEGKIHSVFLALA
jgi:hypothetical protein